jgi:hypothetical protein
LTLLLDLEVSRFKLGCMAPPQKKPQPVSIITTDLNLQTDTTEEYSLVVRELGYPGNIL